MALLLLLAFIAVPLIEIAVFVEVGEEIGALSTILATVLTALAGMALLRSQGLATLERARANLDKGVMPARELFDGVCLLLAGALLLVPGFVTDGLGLLLFVPALRAVLRRFVGRHVNTDGVELRQGHSTHRPNSRPRSDVIEGEYREVNDDDEGDPPPPGGRKGIS